MLRFAGDEKYKPSKWRGYEAERSDAIRYVPTVDDTEDTLVELTKAVAWQIITGQGIYWGWEVERHVENDIQHVIHNRKKKDRKKKPGKVRIERVKPWKPRPEHTYQFKFNFKGNVMKPLKKRQTPERLHLFNQMYRVLRKAGKNQLEARTLANQLLSKATMAE